MESNLIKLIKSLKQGEKRFVTLELSRYKKETDLLKLYQLISNAPTITDADLRKKIKVKKKIAQLGINKHKLFNVIMDTLQLFHVKSSPQKEVTSMIQQSYILEEKNLIQAKTELLLKANAIAKKYELKGSQLEILNLLQRDKRNTSVELIHQAESISKEFVEERKLNQLLNQAISFDRQSGSRLNTHQNTFLKKIMQYALEIKCNSFASSYYSYRTCFTYFAVIGDRQKEYQYGQSIIKLFQDHSYMLDIESWRIEYIESLGNFIPSFINLKKTNQLDFIYKEIDRLHVPELYKVSININILDSYIQRGKYTESEKKLKEIQKNIDFYKRNLSTHNLPILYFNLAILNFGLKKFSNTLLWLNEIINNAEKNPITETIYGITRLYRILVFYELGHLDIIENQLRSTSRYFSKQCQPFTIDTTVVKYIRKIIATNREQEKLVIFKQMRTDLLKIAKDPMESRTLYYFDFISWVESKIEKKSFAEIVQRKYE